jgi:hypothetical protein
MREIKFRGKRIDNCEWIEGDLATKSTYGEEWYGISPKRNSIAQVC